MWFAPCITQYVSPATALELALPVCRDLGETFKWAFLGTSNTDTAIFVDAAHSVLKGLDADMPYFLTGQELSCMPCQSAYKVASGVIVGLQTGSCGV